mmetsp:Transcript_47538/g.133827  ORF Transcript_47538/g.133827 Transcript_47538/m.133827 type:complete len:234 (-) Transcript_47538:734-1435(-)
MFGRGLPGDVRARGEERQGPPCGDLPHQRHDPQGKGRLGGRREHQDHPRGPEGGVGDHHVHRCGPERQVPDLQARHREGHRPPADRDVQPAHPHRGPRRGLPPPGVRRPRRLLVPHVGRHGLRRPEDLGRAVRRGAGEVAASVVWRVGGPRGVRRPPQHGADLADHPHPQRRGRGPRRRDAALRQRPGVRGEGDGAQGLRLPQRGDERHASVKGFRRHRHSRQQLRREAGAPH